MSLALSFGLTLNRIGSASGGGVPDVTAPVLSGLAFDDPNDEFDLTITEASGSVTLVWATSDTGVDPTFTIGGGWVGTTYESGSQSLVSGNTSFSGWTAVTPYGTRRMSVYAYDASNNLSLVSRQNWTHAAVPSAFVDADWSVATGSGGGQLDVTIATLPNANGDTITDVEYDLDASGSWISSGGTTSFTISGLTASTSYAVRLRAVNDEGAGAAGNSESATSGAAAANLLASGANAADQASYTFTGINVPAGATVALFLMMQGGITNPTATLDGNSMTIQNGGAHFGEAIFLFTYTNGGGAMTNVNLVATPGTGSPVRCSYFLADVNGKSYNSNVSADSSVTTATLDINTSAGDVVIGHCVTDAAGATSHSGGGGFSATPDGTLNTEGTNRSSIFIDPAAAGGTPEAYSIATQSGQTLFQADSFRFV